MAISMPFAINRKEVRRITMTRIKQLLQGCALRMETISS